MTNQCVCKRRFSFPWLTKNLFCHEWFNRWPGAANTNTPCPSTRGQDISVGWGLTGGACRAGDAWSFACGGSPNLSRRKLMKHKPLKGKNKKILGSSYTKRLRSKSRVLKWKAMGGWYLLSQNYTVWKGCQSMCDRTWWMMEKLILILAETGRLHQLGI